MSKSILISIFFLGIFTWSLQAQNKHKMIVNGLIVEKEFINKAGKSSGFKELYFRLSERDYFIKFCASAVSKEALNAYLETRAQQNPEKGKNIRLKIEILEGAWDICDELIQVQSRIGQYIIIKKIIR